MTTESELDAMLAAPLEPVDDHGFSRAIAAKIAVRENGGAWFELGAAAATLVLVAFFIPVVRLTAPFESVAINLAVSLPFVTACAAIALTHATLRLLPD
jgi:hypothetical protein